MHKRLFRFLVPEPVRLSAAERWRTTLAAFLGVSVLAAVSFATAGLSAAPLMIASMGASAVLLFALPNSPLAQPWPFAGSHLFSAAIGIGCASWIPEPIVAAGAAVALSVGIMHITHTLHPPGGATALLPVLSDGWAREAGLYFLWDPVGLNVAVMLAAAYVLNNLVLGRTYPIRPFEPAEDEVHHHADPKSLDRVGITHEDLHRALADLDVYLDVTEEELNRIYRRAGMHAYRRRMGEITCGDIMSKDVVSVTPATDLEIAWSRLRFHKVTALPVIDDEERVVGIIGLTDVLRRVDLGRYSRLDERLVRFVRRTLRIAGHGPRTVGQIMTPRPMTAGTTTHIAELVPLLSDHGYHHLPVVDDERRLVGIVTQSDLIAALYAGSVEGLRKAAA